MSDFLRSYLVVFWFGLVALLLASLLLGIAVLLRRPTRIGRNFSPTRAVSTPLAKAGHRARFATTCSHCSS